MACQAPRSPRTRWLLDLAACAVVGLIAAGLVGCDSDKGKADRRVDDSLEQASVAGDATPDARSKAHQSLDAAAKEADASYAQQLRAKSLLADAELREAQDAVALVATNSAEIDRQGRAVAQLTAGVAADNRTVAALGKYQPDPVLTALKAESAGMSGSDDKPTWVQTDAGTLASLAAADKAAAALQQQIDQLAQQAKTESDQRNDLLAKADQLSERSQREHGATSVDLFTQGADARKQAGELAVKIDQDNSQLARAKADLAVQQSHQAAVKAAVGRVDERTTMVNESWTAIGAQVQQAKAHAQSLLGEAVAPAPAPTPGKPTPRIPMTIAARSARIAQLLQQNRDLRARADTHFNNAIGFYKDALDRATKLKTELSDPAHTDRPDRADHAAFEVQLAATDPGQFRYLMGVTQLDRAEFHAREAAEAKVVADLAAAVKPVFDTAGLTVPPGLDDPNGDLANGVTKARTVAQNGFKDATETLDNLLNGDASMALKQGAQVASMFAQYDWSMLPAAGADATEAQTHLAAARTHRDNAVNLGGSLPTLPAELALPLATSTATPAAEAPAAGEKPTVRHATPGND